MKEELWGMQIIGALEAHLKLNLAGIKTAKNHNRIVFEKLLNTAKNSRMLQYQHAGFFSWKALKEAEEILEEDVGSWTIFRVEDAPTKRRGAILLMEEIWPTPPGMYITYISL